MKLTLSLRGMFRPRSRSAAYHRVHAELRASEPQQSKRERSRERKRIWVQRGELIVCG